MIKTDCINCSFRIFPLGGLNVPRGLLIMISSIKDLSSARARARRGLSALEGRRKESRPDKLPRAHPDSGLDAWDERGTTVVRARAWPGHVAGLRTPVRRYLRSLWRT